MNRQMTYFVRAVMQGMTGAGLFRRLRYPGQPEVFMGTVTADEARSSALYQKMDQAVTKIHERESADAELATYYTRLYRTEAHDHIDHGTCTAH